MAIITIYSPSFTAVGGGTATLNFSVQVAATATFGGSASLTASVYEYQAIGGGTMTLTCTSGRQWSGQGTGGGTVTLTPTRNPFRGVKTSGSGGTWWTTVN